MYTVGVASRIERRWTSPVTPTIVRHPVRVRAAPVVNALADRILVRPEAPRDRLAHDGDLLSILSIAVLEAAAAHDRNAERLEVFIVSRLDRHDRIRRAVGVRLAFDVEAPEEHVRAERAAE